MSERQCSVKECDRPHDARGYCKLHYKRWSKWGDPLIVKQVQYTNPEESFEARTMPVTETGCLLWAGNTSSKGYGLMTVDGSTIRAHRYAWERENGPIPKELYIDHKCHTPACCNVAHLRLATNAENNRNRAGAYANSVSGRRGVSWNKKAGKWEAGLMLDGKSLHLGLFTDVEEAADVVSAAREELYGKFAGKG